MTRDRDDKAGDIVAAPEQHFEVRIDKDFFQTPFPRMTGCELLQLADKYATLMRELTGRHDGAFLALSR